MPVRRAIQNMQISYWHDKWTGNISQVILYLTERRKYDKLPFLFHFFHLSTTFTTLNWFKEYLSMRISSY